ncbi:methyltransferase family protein [Thermosporothrix hazakensis]|jgi:SAM-dependent methyltransferase|uniref:Methyltransferase family protein n=1 Tax=Thermosporothrix hazakensis TaxID=644383 RepID=A0A326UAN7_THEHA|nr:class I SAM-dependent methyltransferase [Thermosporothrix hazakensis]PZW32639.1 methyltransferase family protein [Thermosporothrix hazakensis]GCE49992.1 class I SAM-dependent methyltransferase [Thermosporothrix hazakensis]
MTSEPTSSTLHEETRRIWDQNASFWDASMSDEGNDFQRLLVYPASERLLQLQPGETVLELACGNGVFARRMAQSGAHVVATDFSATMIERARARIAPTDQIEFRQVDATREEELLALGVRRFDAAVCNMGIMDMTEIEPLMRGIRQVVKPGGRFVFTLSHPCFNHSGISLVAEETTVNGEIKTTHAVKVMTYLSTSPQKGVAMQGQPVAQYYFDRPLHFLFNACFSAGLMLDGLEEPAFPSSPKEAQRSSFDWAHYDVPPILAARLRIPA